MKTNKIRKKIIYIKISDLMWEIEFEANLKVERKPSNSEKWKTKECYDS